MPRSSAGLQVRAVDSTADLLQLHRFLPERYPHLLQSVAHGTPQARFDILFAFPAQTLALNADGTLKGPCAEADGFLAALDRWWQRDCHAEDVASLPFRGGWFLYLGYELAAEIEPSLELPAASDGLPTAFAVRCPAAVIRDHASHRTYLVAEAEHAAVLEDMEADLGACQVSQQGDALPVPGTVGEEPPQRYLDGVVRIRDYVHDGDVFQVNLSRTWRLEYDRVPDPAALYERLRTTNPAPFAALCRWRDCAIISSSPERLVRTQARQVETRPIAGTRPRGSESLADQARSRELLGHPKERAEHIMLIDLERNDLGRICEPGSIEVNELMVLETYAHVHHIVSNVRGTLRKDVTPGQVIAAVFPGGTITGCPKVRCMEIISELEQAARGAYTGALGYLNRDGDMDLNILIRTLVQEKQQVHFRAGAGIVADSDPERELQETRAKARGLLLAVAPGHSATRDSEPS